MLLAGTATTKSVMRVDVPADEALGKAKSTAKPGANTKREPNNTKNNASAPTFT